MKLPLLFLTVIVCFNHAFSQSKQELEAREYFWGATDNYSDVTDIPDKWKDESAVVIYKNINYDFHKYGKNVNYKNSIRKRIKLLDNAAVEEFSEFSFVKRFRSEKGYYNRREKGKNFIGIKVVKPDGSEIEIDVEKDAVEVDGETKLAISNLEVGDIIDYYFYKVEPFKSKYAFGFDPVEVVLGEDYPVMEFKLFFETENDFFINFKSYNGAPELSEIPNDERNTRRYELIANDLAKTDFPRWFYPLLELPSYKFQVYFARSGKFENYAMAFLPEKEDIIKNSVSKDEVLDLYDTRLRPSGSTKEIKDYLKDNEFENDSEKVKAIYYYMRHVYMTRYIEAVYVSDAKILDYPFNFYGTNSIFISKQMEFVNSFANVLKELDIDYEFVIAKNRYDGTIDDLLIEDNVKTLIKVNTSSPQFFEIFSMHTSDNQISPYLEGTKAYALSASKNKLDEIKSIDLPYSDHTKSVSDTETTLTINPDFGGVSIESVVAYKGHEKTDEQKDRMFYIDYVNEDYDRYGTKSLTDRIKNKKVRLLFKKEYDALTEKIKNNLKERYEKVASTNLGVDEVEGYDYQILETGRFGFESPFKFSESYEAKNVLIKKAGPNYIMEVGKLIGGQIDLTDKEREREENIYQKYARTLHNKVIIEIPEGYDVSGLDNLNMSVNNETGSFESSAKLEGNQLIINTTKEYKNNYESVDNWPKMIEFLDAAKQFTNEKILLKKV